MKKIFSLVLLASLIFVFGCTNNPISTTENTELQTYENTTDNFSIQFPITREFEENVYNSNVIFFTPMEENDTIRENVGIIKKELDKNYSLEEYYASTRPELESMIPDFVEVSKEDITINGIDAQKLIYQGTQGDFKLQWEQVYLIKDTTVYITTYTATQDTFGEFVQDVDAMVSTLEVK